MTEKEWKYRDAELKAGLADAVAREHGIPKVIAAILLNRGLKSEDIPAFLRKSKKDILNPMLLSDMDKAVERIKKAIDSKEKITVYGDYDVDGITSTALLYDFLKRLGGNVDYYIPERGNEGYGINIMAVNKLHKSGTRLMITVDCGITAIGEVEFAKLQGMDVIVTDHHTCKERLPEAAAAIINPKKPECTYPFDSLAGVGVAFKLVLALAISYKLSTNACFNRYVDLAALGTIADVVPLSGENRIIVDKGLTLLSKTERPGLKALIRVAGAADKPITVNTVAFTLAPRLNAAGRIGTAKTGVELLLADDEKKAEALAEELDRENMSRRETEQQILDEALEMIAADKDFSKKYVIVLAHEDWHRGVIGIVAAKLCEKFYRPCILISDTDGVGKGSGRSIPDFNLFDALTACGSHLTEFGGHSAAAGLNINMSELNAFSDAMNKYAKELFGGAHPSPRITLDCNLNPNDITLENAHMLEKLEPFGMGNERPVFSASGLTVMYSAAVGQDAKHLRLKLRAGNASFYGIAFGLGELAGDIREGSVIDAAFAMNINNYQGRESVQLVIKDLKRH